MKPILLLLCLIALTAPGHASHLVTDEVGHSVTVPDHPHRIISLTPSITETIFELGAADDVVARADYVQYPAEATKKLSVGSISNPSLETILALHPDLILATPRFTQQSVIDQLQRIGIPVYFVEPHGIAGILRSITDLGQAVGREPQATALRARLEQRIDAVRASVKGKPVVSVFWPLAYDPVITIGKGAFITEIIELAGGRSITNDLDQEWPHISMEAVVTRAPQALLMMRDGTITIDILKTRPGWDTLPAVRSGRVYLIDHRVELSSPIAIEALEDLAKEFHP
jgi:iron complex transport system substrate-binding protein